MRYLIAIALLTVPIFAEPPIIGSQTLYPGPGGHSTIGFYATGLTQEAAVETIWVVEVDGAPVWSTKGVCEARFAAAPTPHCAVPIPLTAHVSRVRVRAAGSEEWSPVWPNAMIPCGAFVGQPVHQNVLETLGWGPADPNWKGSECAAPDVPPQPPTAPEGLRILEPK